MDKDEELIIVCRRIVELKPKDLESWLILADRLLSSGKEKDALSAYESVLMLDTQNPHANLNIGIAFHDNALASNIANMVNASSMLEKSVSGIWNLSTYEGNLARLYFCSTLLNSDSATLVNAKTLEEIDPKEFNETQWLLLAKCFVLLGNLQYKTQKQYDAIESYKSSLKYYDNSETRSRIAEIYAEIYTKKGDELMANGRYIRARKEYYDGLKYQPDNTNLQSKYKLAVTKQKRKNLTKLAIGIIILFIAAAIGALIYIFLLLTGYII